MAAAISTLVVSLFYLLAQMAGAGGLVTLLLGVSGEAAQAVVVAVVGALMIFYVLVGGMRGTTYVQVIKASLLIVGAFVMTVWVLGKYGFNLSALLGGAQENAAEGRNVLAPGAQYGLTDTTKLDFVSLGLALVLGTAGLPHVLMRFYTVPTAKDARRSVVWAIWLIGIFYLFSRSSATAPARWWARTRSWPRRRGQRGGTAAGLRARRHGAARASSPASRSRRSSPWSRACAALVPVI